MYEILLIIATLCLVPVIISFGYFKKTSINEYLIMLGIWLLFSINLFSSYIAINTDSIETLLFAILVHVPYIMINYLLFLHGIRLNETYTLISKTLIIFFSSYTLFNLFVFFTTPVQIIAQRYSVLITINNIEIPVSQIGTLIGLTTVIIGYLTVQLAFNSKEVQTIRNVMLISAIVWVILILNIVSIFYTNHDLIYLPAPIGAFVSLLLIAIFTIKYPEGILITKSQIIRALKIYTIVDNSARIPRFGINRLDSYLNNPVIQKLLQEQGT